MTSYLSSILLIISYFILIILNFIQINTCIFSPVGLRLCSF